MKGEFYVWTDIKILEERRQGSHFSKRLKTQETLRRSCPFGIQFPRGSEKHQNVCKAVSKICLFQILDIQADFAHRKEVFMNQFSVLLSKKLHPTTASFFSKKQIKNQKSQPVCKNLCKH